MTNRDSRTNWNSLTTVEDCNEDFLTLYTKANDPPKGTFPMEDVYLGYDHKRNRLQIDVDRHQFRR
jgi:hypothetical protein